MKKKVVFDKKAKKELNQFSISVQNKFFGLIEILSNKGKLKPPEAKKIDKNLFELRIKYQGQYRGFYAYLKKEIIIALHFFQKKGQKTPIKNLKTAKRRLKYYE